MQIFVKIKSSPNEEITLPFTDISKSCPSYTFLTTQICLLTLFMKIKFSRKFPNLQYIGDRACAYTGSLIMFFPAHILKEWKK